jgi:hypothetical protein
MEWEPPELDGSGGGYIKWYLDGEFIYGIEGKVLDLTNTEIPSEPMYLLMNTAVASSWGFPKPCPEGCDCSCYQCGNSDCTCGLPDGFCDNFPAYFEIDYVRVYQAVNESKHVLGCSTPERPTAQFIKGHKEDYINKFEGQKEPLLEIQRGGAYCQESSECGYPEKGSCESNKCVCQEKYTGPKCLSPDGFDDNPPPPEEIQFSQMALPPAMLFMLAISVVVFIIFVGLAVCKRRKHMMTTYDPLMDTSSHNGSGRILGGLQGPNAIPSYAQDSYQKGERGALFNPTGSSNSDQKTVTYCMIDGRLLDDQKNSI